jgi:hypothetical protein
VAITIAAEQSGSPSSSTAPPMSSCGQYMLHRVGKLDTLAGIAIKYGVEVMRREYTEFFLGPFFFTAPYWNTPLEKI